MKFKLRNLATVSSVSQIEDEVFAQVPDMTSPFRLEVFDTDVEDYVLLQWWDDIPTHQGVLRLKVASQTSSLSSSSIQRPWHFGSKTLSNSSWERSESDHTHYKRLLLKDVSGRIHQQAEWQSLVELMKQIDISGCFQAADPQEVIKEAYAIVNENQVSQFDRYVRSLLLKHEGDPKLFKSNSWQTATSQAASRAWIHSLLKKYDHTIQWSLKDQEANTADTVWRLIQPSSLLSLTWHFRFPPPPKIVRCSCFRWYKIWIDGRKDRTHQLRGIYRPRTLWPRHLCNAVAAVRRDILAR
jgi:hypothetical protein